MAVTKEFIAAQFAAARSFLSGSTITIRHRDRKYVCTRGSLEEEELVGDAGSTMGALGACRAVVSELGPVRPKSGDTIDVYDEESKKWQSRVIKFTRPDETHATMLIMYGERYDQ